MPSLTEPCYNWGMTDTDSTTLTARRARVIDFWREAHERIMRTELERLDTGRLPTSEYRERLVAEVFDAATDEVLGLGRLSANRINHWMVEDGVPKAKLMRVRRTLRVAGPSGPYEVGVSKPLQCWAGLTWRAPCVPFQSFREWLAARLGTDTPAGRLAARLEAERVRCALMADWPDDVWSHLVRHGPSPAFGQAYLAVVAEYRRYVRESATQAALTTRDNPGSVVLSSEDQER